MKKKQVVEMAKVTVCFAPYIVCCLLYSAFPEYINGWLAFGQVEFIGASMTGVLLSIYWWRWKDDSQAPHRDSNE